MTVEVSPLAGKTAPASMLVNVPRLVTAYFSGKPDPTLPSQRVTFGTSGHRGSAFNNAFNEAHILAISQALCDHRRRIGIDGPLFIGIDTHALAEPALAMMLAGTAVVALAALVVGYVLLKEVLAAGQGTAKMQDIAKAVQEGAAAYLKRQRNTLVVFGAIVFLLLFALPADDWSERIGRSLFFLVGAAFSFTIGYLGMWLATQANLRVAAASREEGGRETAMRIAFRTGGVVGMITVGLGLFGVVVDIAGGQEQRLAVLVELAAYGSRANRPRVPPGLRFVLAHSDLKRRPTR